jgi:endonuclease/exonuclease/phosphatase family protein
MMRIVSWNINSLRKRQDRLFAWLEATEPDVVCLQETKCTDDQFPALALQAAGYYAAYHGEKSYNGVAILSKTELRDVRPSLCDEVIDPQARVIAATLGRLRVFSIYAPNGQAVSSPAYEYIGIAACEIASRKKSLATLWSAVISTSRRKILTFTMQICGVAPSCVPTANVPRFSNCVKPACATPCEFIITKANFSAGGIIRCVRLREIAVCALTRFWLAKN